MVQAQPVKCFGWFLAIHILLKHLLRNGFLQDLGLHPCFCQILCKRTLKSSLQFTIGRHDLFYGFG
ncbi:hypothetical protein KSD_72890 [Ktedonobacter sp. SOSP1-85]|nr:hypothetical protein KSD_72890 [Ktedonobacter sp. SOSP1-85]